VDNLTHSLVGLAAAKAGFERTTAYATAVCVIAANLPDADIVTLFNGSSDYLANHRGITHSIVGTLALGLLLPLLFFACERLLARLRGRPARARLGGLMVCSLALIATHPLLDWMNSYGVRPFLPWDGRWVYGDILFVVDPWLWLMLGGACFLLTARSARRVAVWVLLATLLTILFFFVLGRRFGADVQLTTYVLWLACLSGLYVLHRRGVAKRFGSKVAIAALGLVVVYCGALALVQSRARGMAGEFANGIAARGGERVLRVAAMPVFADTRKWRCLAETDRSTLRFDMTLGSSSLEDLDGVVSFKKPEGEAARLVERASANARARVLLDFARFPVARVARSQYGETLVQFADLRFTQPGASGGLFALDVAVPTAP
jgi:inner membrane protein